jgi:hypothetical protein
MRALPPSPGLEAPAALPAAAAASDAPAVSAQTSVLGGSESVTLIATTVAHPVNDPSLSAADGTALGTFTSTPTASSADAAAQVAQAAAATLATCMAPAVPLVVGPVTASACTTPLGPVVAWSNDEWRVQVIDDTGPTMPADQASALATWMASHQMPTATPGVVDVEVSGATAASTLTWAQGATVYGTHSTLTPTAAAELAASMRPWKKD